MDTITYQNIKIEGIPFSKITKLQITHQTNEHGFCHIEGEIDPKQAKEFVQRADERFAVQVTTSAEGQPSRLFYGGIQTIREKDEGSYSSLILDAVTLSGRIDAKKDSRTFQNTSQTYGQMLNTLLEGIGTVQMIVTDKPIGSFIIKCDETEWEFIVRMASQLGAPACANIIAQTPQIIIGIPPASKTMEINTHSYGTGKVIDNGGEACQTVKSYEYAYLGDCVSFQGRSYRVKTINADLYDGILECTYGFIMPTGFSVPRIANSQASGRMMTGIVQGVEADKVQVFLNSVDSSYDAGGDWWFPYSTAYSSADGSGWYSMPSENDEVRVFFPSGNEGEAFAAGAVSKHVRADVKDKSWSGINGKEILMTKDGLVITCKEGKIYIKLSDDKGIEIISDLDINVTSGTNVNISAGDTVKVIAEKEIVVGTAESHLNIRKEGIVATGKTIVIT